MVAELMAFAPAGLRGLVFAACATSLANENVASSAAPARPKASGRRAPTARAQAGAGQAHRTLGQSTSRLKAPDPLKPARWRPDTIR